MLSSLLPSPFSAVVLGASGGIGHALVTALSASPNVTHILACVRNGTAPAGEKIRSCVLDVTDEVTIARAAQEAGTLPSLRLVIVATGVLHEGDLLQPERALRQIDPARLARAFAVNATGPILVAKHFLPLLAPAGPAVFAALSARVGSISDNRLGGWYAYRASKAALNMLLATLALEVRAQRPETMVVGLHPGTVDTSLSKPFQRNVPEGKLFVPSDAAARLLSVVGGLTPADSGGVFAWDGARVPALATGSTWSTDQVSTRSAL